MPARIRSRGDASGWYSSGTRFTFKPWPSSGVASVLDGVAGGGGTLRNPDGAGVKGAGGGGGGGAGTRAGFAGIVGAGGGGVGVGVARGGAGAHAERFGGAGGGGGGGAGTRAGFAGIVGAGGGAGGTPRDPKSRANTLAVCFSASGCAVGSRSAMVSSRVTFAGGVVGADGGSGADSGFAGCACFGNFGARLNRRLKNSITPPTRTTRSWKTRSSGLVISTSVCGCAGLPSRLSCLSFSGKRLMEDSMWYVTNSTDEAQDQRQRRSVVQFRSTRA